MRKTNDASPLSTFALMAGLLYLLIAWTIFQWRNPTANEMSFLRDFPSVVLFKKLPEYQVK